MYYSYLSMYLQVLFLLCAFVYVDSSYEKGDVKQKLKFVKMMNSIHIERKQLATYKASKHKGVMFIPTLWYLCM